VKEQELYEYRFEIVELLLFFGERGGISEFGRHGIGIAEVGVDILAGDIIDAGEGEKSDAARRSGEVRRCPEFESVHGYDSISPLGSSPRDPLSPDTGEAGDGKVRGMDGV
jgi:hypothetical protein